MNVVILLSSLDVTSNLVLLKHITYPPFVVMLIAILEAVFANFISVKVSTKTLPYKRFIYPG